jgi:hypothetical protein
MCVWAEIVVDDVLNDHFDILVFSQAKRMS